MSGPIAAHQNDAKEGRRMDGGENGVATVRLVAAVSFWDLPTIDGSLPELRPFNPASESFAEWNVIRSAWFADVREALGLAPMPELHGLFAVEDFESMRLLEAGCRYVIDCGEEFGWGPWLDGGLALVISGKGFVAPTCCVDLGEGVRDWILMCSQWPDSWASLESGHPGVLARRRGEMIDFSAQLDDLPDPIQVAVSVELDDLRAALPLALSAIDVFAESIGRALVDRGFPNGVALGRIVAGIDARQT